VTEVLAATGHWAPWWAWLIVVLTCVATRTFAYVYAQRLWYQFAAKALDKAPPDQVAAVVEAITGPGNSARLCPGMHRSASQESERNAPPGQGQGPADAGPGPSHAGSHAKAVDTGS
jgi:hypothetical protein